MDGTEIGTEPTLISPDQKVWDFAREKGIRAETVIDMEKRLAALELIKMAAPELTSPEQIAILDGLAFY